MVTALVLERHDSPRTVAHGYWFQGSDYTFNWTNEPQQHPLATGLDGAYVTVSPTQTGHRIGTDHDGNRRLFLYESAGQVAVSDSLVALARHARSSGWPLTLVPHQLEGWGSGQGSLMEQLWSYQTVFHEIALVPHFLDVIIPREGHAQLERRPFESFLEEVDGYPQALSTWMATWMGRVRTVLSSPSVVPMTELSGGLDSRTVFALFANAIEGSPKLAGDLRVFSSPRKQKRHERELAQQVVSPYDLDLKSSRNAANQRLTELDLSCRQRAWTLNRMGQYILSSGMPLASPAPGSMHFTGLGGEKFRPFYHKWGNSPTAILQDRSHRFSQRSAGWAVPPIIQDMRSSLEVASRDPMAGPDDNFTHYRAFRSRFHMGCPSSEKVVVSPFTGRWMDRTAWHAGRRRLESGQIFYDVMHNLAPHLLDVAFDKPAKSPSPEITDNLTTVGSVRSSVGKVTISAEPTGPTRPYSQRPRGQQVLSRLREQYLQVAHRLPRHLQDRDRRMRDLLDEGVKRGGLPSQPSAHFLHFALLWEELERLALV